MPKLPPPLPRRMKSVDGWNAVPARASGAIAAAAALGGLLAGSSTAVAQYDPPADYYNAVTLSNAQSNAALFKDNIHNAMCRNYFVSTSTTPIYRSYDDARQGLGAVDATSVGASTIYLCYTGAINSGTWDAAATWNREHSWPQSFGMTEGTRQYSDLHLLRACATAVNGARGNTAFGDNSGQYNPNKGGPTWDERGDMARAMFYADTRYDGTANTVSGISDGTDLQLVNLTTNPTSGQSKMGDLASLLRWNYQDPPSQKERLREQLVFDKTLNPSHYQGNRSAFVDHPEWVWAVFGSGNNNSQISISGTTPTAGASTSNIDLGRVMVGRTLGTQTIAVAKSGSNPTYFDVATFGSGTITSSAGSLSISATRQQAFDYNAASRPMTVGLNASTATNGLKTGSITIDNTDVTTGGSGLGSGDGNDTINISAAVLSNRVLTAQSVDYGRISANHDYTAYTRITTAGDDNSFTRVTASNAGVSNDNLTVSAAPVSRTFTSDSDLMVREVNSRFSAIGSYYGNLNLPVTGEGLIGEAVNSLSLAYHAEVVDPSRPGDGDDYTGGEPGSDHIYIDFGTVDIALRQASNSLAVGFGLTEDERSALPDPISLEGLGDTDLLTMNLSQLSALLNGQGGSLAAMLSPSRIGELSATYTLGGSTNDAITIQILANVVPEPASVFVIFTVGLTVIQRRGRRKPA